jgi:uncharacterized membrane protein
MTLKNDSLPLTSKLAVAGVFAAVVYVATAIFMIPIPATNGYFNLGETVIYIAALLFGSLVGAFAGGIGAALADTLSPYSFFAPGTLVIKGCEGAIVGFLSRKLSEHKLQPNLSAIVSVVIGGAEMVAGYFLYETLVLGYTAPVAAAEIPFNAVQMTVGLVVAVPVVRVVLRIFPQLKR